MEIKKTTELAINTPHQMFVLCQLIGNHTKFDNLNNYHNQIFDQLEFPAGLKYPHLNSMVISTPENTVLESKITYEGAFPEDLLFKMENMMNVSHAELLDVLILDGNIKVTEDLNFWGAMASFSNTKENE